MRNAVAIACFMILAATSVFAQGLEGGLKGGLLSSTVHADGTSDVTFGWRQAFVAGAFVTWPFLPSLELQPEILYTPKGATLDDEGLTSRLLLDYLEVPILVRFTRRLSDAGGLYLASGPAVALRLRARTRADFGGATEEIDVTDDVESTDVGVVIAGGFERGRIVVDGRYTLGLRDIDKDRSDDITMATRAWALTAGFKF